MSADEQTRNVGSIVVSANVSGGVSAASKASGVNDSEHSEHSSSFQAAGRGFDTAAGRAMLGLEPPVQASVRMLEPQSGGEQLKGGVDESNPHVSAFTPFPPLGSTMKSAMLFQPIAPPLCSSPVPAPVCTVGSPSPTGSSTTNTLFPPFPYPTSVAPPSPDDTGVAPGIPLVRGARLGSCHLRSGRIGSSTLPPLPDLSKSGTPPPTHTAESPKAPATPPPVAKPDAAAIGGAVYRKVFVPTMVMHNGKPQQLLVPMMCLVAPPKPRGAGTGSGLPALAPPAAAPPPPPAPTAKLPAKGKAASRGCARRNEDSQSLGPSYQPLKKVSKQSRYGTRASALTPRKGSGQLQAVHAEYAQQGGADALTLLADAALLDIA